MVGILFDLDGTLLDTLEDLTDSVNFALDSFGYPRRSLEEVRTFVGNGADRLIRLSVPEGADAAPVLAVYQSHYRTHSRIKTKPYDGILPALQEAQSRWPIAVVSNKPDEAVKLLCADLFPGVPAMGESPACPRKPAPDMVLQAMRELNIDRCIYVGDSEVDVLTAKNAGVPCLSVTWGFRSEAELQAAGASHFCRSADSLISCLAQLEAADGQ